MICASPAWPDRTPPEPPVMTKPVLSFWYEFASPYSYLAAMRIEALAEAAGVSIRWRPFLLGPIFAAQGWTSSPFNLFPAKGRHMRRDVEREAAALELPLRWPEPFPPQGLLAARVALVGSDAPWGGAFSKAVYRALFGEGRAIGEPAVIGDLLQGFGLADDNILSVATTDANKARLKSQTQEAADLGIFGAPSFVTPDGELFWGNDRLETALAWCVKTAR